MITSSDIFSAPATVRWKRTASSSNRGGLTLASSRRIRQMVSSQNASNFLNFTENSTNDTAKVSKGEELKEISSQLKFLRQHLDVSNTLHDMRVKHMQNKSFDLQTVKLTSSLMESSAVTQEMMVKKLEIDLENMKNQQKDCSQDTLIYRHMLERMRVTRIFLDVKGFELMKTLKLNSQILGEELEKKRKVRELRIQTKVAVSNLETYIERERKERVHDVQVIEKDAQKKRESSQNREIRMRRQIEISEAAADEDRNMRAIQLRESLMLHRFWNSIMYKRLNKDRSQFRDLETAFDEVKKATNMINTEDIIEKVLTRETSFSDIIETVNFTKSRIREYIGRNKEIEDKLATLGIVKTEISQVKSLEIEVTQKSKQIEIDKERCIKLTGVYKKVQYWTIKALGSLEFLSGDQAIDKNILLQQKLMPLVGRLKNTISNILKLKKKELQMVVKPKRNRDSFQTTRYKVRFLESSEDLLKGLNSSDSITNIKKSNYK